MKFYESEEFKTLNRSWKKKLKASGFKDIEISEDELVRHSFHLTQAYVSGTYDYYLAAQEFLLQHKFKTELDRKIWEWHCEGRSCRYIASKLRRQSIFPHLNHNTIASRIRSIESNMLEKTA
jgi:hypothetical protein